MVRVSGCGPEGRRFEPGYPPHIFRSVPRPFTCHAADIAEGRRIFYVPAFAFTLPFCLLRIFAFFLTLPAFSVSLCAALRVLPCLRSLLHSLRASCAFRPKPAFFVRFALFNRGSFAFCAPFCSVRLSSFLRAFCDCAFSFSLLVIFSASPAPPARRFAVFPPWERTMPNRFYRGVAQLVERVVWDHQAAGSSPVTPTRLSLEPIRAPGFFYLG